MQQIVGFGSKVRKVRPLIADAAVYTMEQQAIPRGSLSWQLESSDGDVIGENLIHPAAATYSSQQAGMPTKQHYNHDLTSTAAIGKHMSVETALTLHRQEPANNVESSSSQFSEKVISTRSQEFEEAVVSKRTGVQVLLPVFIFSLVVSFLSWEDGTKAFIFGHQVLAGGIEQCF